MKLSLVTTNRTSDLPQRSGSFQAMVRAGDSMTSYLRSGRGEPVILLRRTRVDDAADAALHESLWGLVLGDVSSAYRAILPDHAPNGADFATWFRSFLDGLGLGAVRVVADASYALRCIESDLLCADWIVMLVVVTTAADHASVQAALDARSALLGEPGTPTVAVVSTTEFAGAPHAAAAAALQHLRVVVP